MNKPELKGIQFYRCLPLVVFLALWELLVHGDEQLIFFFGSPSQIAINFWDKAVDGSIAVDFFATFIEALAGFVLGNLAGTFLGLSLWYSRTAFAISKPYIIALGSAPIFALSPILVIWFGTGMFSKVMIAALSTVFIALFQAYTGASEVSNDYLRLMKTFGANKNQIFKKVIAPSAAVWVISAFRMNVGFAILGAFIGEFISSNKGLGHLIVVASGLFNIPLVMCGVLLLVLIAMIFNFAVSKIEQPLKHIIVRYL